MYEVVVQPLYNNFDALIAYGVFLIFLFDNMI